VVFLKLNGCVFKKYKRKLSLAKPRRSGKLENIKLEPTNVNRHIVADLFEITNVDFFDSVENMKSLIHAAAIKAKMTIVGESFKQFEPSGSSGVILLAESHLTYHLWKDERIITLDIFTCGHEGNPQVALDFMIEALKPNLEKSKIIHLDRSFYL